MAAGAGFCYIASMNIAQRQSMTVADYLAWGDALEERRHTELINGQIITMSPESAAHNRTKLRALMALRQALESIKRPHEIFIDGMTVPIDANTAFEPDVLVHFGAPIAAKQLTVPDPLIVVEVLSPSSVRSDSKIKLIGYFKVPSVQHYLVIDPDKRVVTHHLRAPDGGITAHSSTDGALRLDPPGIELKVADLFG
jgi:Uma2 family endonuclease